ncbi:MAG: hypothetical protein ACMUIM_05445 [bacterium]
MKVRSYLQINFLFIFILWISIGIFIAAPVGSQYSVFTLAPPNSALGYGGLFNPYVFWPSSNIKAAASTTSILPFASFGFGGIGFGNPLLGLSQTSFGLSNILGNSLGSPLLSLSQTNFNPSFGFGASFTNPLLLGINSINPFSLGALGVLGSAATLAPAPVSPIRTAAQAGTWTGTWQSTYIAFPILWNTGPMSLNIVEDPLLGTVVGTAVLAESRYASIPFEVAGVIVNNTISVEGFLFTGYDCAITGIFTSPTTMTGFYTVLGTKIPIMDEGIFNLTLIPPVIF